MNANEMADLMILFDSGRIYEHSVEIATMLRQQQAEIEALKQIIDANNLNQNIGQFVKPTNEPVAWMRQDFDGEWVEVMPEKGIPFYTHPVKALTDEEINQLAEEHLDMDWQTGVIEFARAILRKAQEK